jgi:hypothetical protein
MTLLALLQAVTSPEFTTWPALGVGGLLAGVMFKFYRDDRKSSEDRYERLAKEAQERYAALAKESNERAAMIAADFRQIVEDNTKALTELSVAIHTDNSVSVRQLLDALKSERLRPQKLAVKQGSSVGQP